MENSSLPSKYHRMRLVQEEKQWDLERDLPWDAFETTRPLLPDCRALAEALALTPAEELACSQLLGLMAVQAISEHEKILGVVRELCWRRPLARLDAGEDVVKLGEQFFKEEAKHSLAFARYVETFARGRGIGVEELRAVLPSYRARSWSTGLFLLNSLCGGRAIWWLVMITEEESLALFRDIRSRKAEIEPLFYALNQHHFEEEIRHSSYAPLMLRMLGTSRLDFLLAEALHRVWVLRQLFRLRRLRRGSETSGFHAELRSVLAKFQRLPWRRRLALVATKIPYVSQLMQPRRHKAIGIELQRNAELA